MKLHTQTSFLAALFAALLSSCSDSSSAGDADSFDAAVVCPAEGLNAYGESNRGSFVDARDGRVYKYTTIGNQVWMAENLKYEAPYSECFSKIENYCDSVGRFYKFKNGMSDRELLETVCPSGWHVPSTDEWAILYFNLGENANASLRAGATIPFDSSLFRASANFFAETTDDCGFSVLPKPFDLEDSTAVPPYRYISPDFGTSTFESVVALYGCTIGTQGFAFFRNPGSSKAIRCVKD